MKTKTTLLFLMVLFVYSKSLNAQFLQNDFNKSLFYKDINAIIMYSNGDVESIKTFYHPIMISDPSFPLGEWKPLTNKEEKGISKNDLKAISIDGKLWMPRPTPLGNSWVLMRKQGAIERYSYPTNTDGRTKIIEEKMNRDLVKDRAPKDIKIVLALATKKLNNPPIPETQMLNFAKEMGKMTSDYTELSDKITSKTKGYKFGSVNDIITEYNDWYNKENPGEIDIITREDWGDSGMAVEGKTMKEGLADLKKMKTAGQEKYEAKKASRPTTASPEIASAKPNVPVKKETFTQKINRIKADGNKVGVQFINPYVYIKPPADNSSMMGSGVGGLSGGMLSDKKAVSKHPKDTLEAYPELKELALSYVKELNTAFETDVFELIEDNNQIPYRKVMGSYLIDDWWATKYKVLIVYNIDTYYELSKQTKTYKGDFRATSHVTGTEFFLKKGKPSQKSIIGLAAMGHYHKALKESADDNIKTIADIQDNMDGSISGNEIYETLLKERKSSFDKFVSKKKK